MFTRVEEMDDWSDATSLPIIPLPRQHNSAGDSIDTPVRVTDLSAGLIYKDVGVHACGLCDVANNDG